MVQKSLLALVLLAFAGCARPAGPAVIHGGGISLTAADVKARLSAQPSPVRLSLEQPGRKREFVENMISFELLAHQATQEGLLDDPAVQFALKRALVARLHERFKESRAAAETVPEPEARKYYDDHLADFGRPARVRAAVILVNGEDAPRRAARLLSRLQGGARFEDLARQESADESTRALGGDAGLKTREELAIYGTEVAEAAFALAAKETTRSAVETPQGLFIVRVLERQEAQARPFEDLKGSIAARILEEKIDGEYDAMVKKLRADAKIELTEELLQHSM